MQKEIDILLVCEDRNEAFTINSVMSKIGGYSSLALIEDFDEVEKHLSKVVDKKYRFPELILLNVGDQVDRSLKVTSFVKADKVLRSVPVVVLLKEEHSDHSDDFYKVHANCCVIRNSDPDHFVNDIKNIWSFWAETAKLNCRELI